jgi:hypothetical protein
MALACDVFLWELSDAWSMELILSAILARGDICNNLILEVRSIKMVVDSLQHATDTWVSLYVVVTFQDGLNKLRGNVNAPWGVIRSLMTP